MPAFSYLTLINAVRLVSITISIILFTTLTACSSGGDQSERETPPPVATLPITPVVTLLTENSEGLKFEAKDIVNSIDFRVDIPPEISALDKVVWQFNNVKNEISLTAEDISTQSVTLALTQFRPQSNQNFSVYFNTQDDQISQAYTLTFSVLEYPDNAATKIQVALHEPVVFNGELLNKTEAKLRSILNEINYPRSSSECHYVSDSWEFNSPNTTNPLPNPSAEFGSEFNITCSYDSNLIDDNGSTLVVTNYKKTYPLKDFRADLVTQQAHLVQMHLHGHSNHNGSDKPGSMQWHSSQIAHEEVGDVLWWNDHVRVFNQKSDQTIPLNQTTTALIPNGINILSNDRVLGLPSKLSDSCSANSFSLEETHVSWSTLSTNSTWKKCRLTLNGPHSDGRIKGVVWNRPISSGAIFELNMQSTQTSNDTNIEIQFGLAWHQENGVENQHRIHFKIIPETAPLYTSVIANGTVEVGIHYRLDGIYKLNLLEASSSLPDGNDNTISDVSFVSESRNNRVSNLKLGLIKLYSTQGDVEHQLQKTHDFASHYGQRYNQKQFIGLEHGDPSTGYHFNAFLPSNKSSTALIDPNTSASEWLMTIHDSNGIVSLNHPFGTSTGFRDLKSEAALQQDFSRLLDLLLNEQEPLNIDALEVGYPARGGATLNSHLRAWDTLSANGKQIMGLGVSDSHGGTLSVNFEIGSFASWVISKSSSDEEIIDGVKRRAGYFASPFVWNGSFTFRLGNAFVGETLTTSKASEKLEFELTNVDLNEVNVYLVQGLIDSQSSTTYIHEKTLLDKHRISIDTQENSFVRLEAYKKETKANYTSGIPLAFTNKIYIKKP